MKKQRKMLSMALAVSMSVPTLLSGFSPSVMASEQEDSSTVTIASFNIAAKGSKTNEIGALMSQYHVDLAGFQEVDEYNSRNNIDMMGQIASAAGESYEGFFQKAIDYAGGAYGIGTLSKTSLTSKSAQTLPTDAYEGRVFQRSETEIDGKTIAFYNTHLTWEDPTLRARQMEILFQVMEEDTTTYKVLTGDFNAQDSTDEWNVFLQNYTMANGNPDFLDTYIPVDATMSTNAIDNIITSRNLKLLDVQAIEEDAIGSDHRALVATFEFLEEEETSTLLLEKLIEKAETLLQKTAQYTPESLAQLAQAIDVAKEAEPTTQSAVNDQAALLQNAIDQLESLPAELVAYYDFEGDQPLSDKTQRGNDGKTVGSVSYAPSVSDLGQALDTSSGYVSIAKTTEDLIWKTEDLSIGFWYKATNPGTWSALMGDKNWDSGANPGVVIVQGQGQFYTSYAANGFGQQENIVSGTASKVFDGKWHYITAVLDRDTTSDLYVDGVKIASTSIASTKDVSVTTAYPFNIGADGNGGYGINSLIDDVKIYRSVLSEQQIQQEYEAHKDQTGAALDALQQKVENELANLVIDPALQKEMPEFVSEDEQFIARFYCSENDVLISDDGEILRQPLVDTRAQVSYLITENKEDASDEEGTLVQDHWITVKGSQKAASNSNPEPQTIPSLQEWKGAQGSFTLKDTSKIVVDHNSWDILEPAARITSEDFYNLFGRIVPVVKGDIAQAQAGDIVLTFEAGDEALGEQGYILEADSVFTIRATQYRGALYGTRSLLQGMLASGDESFPCGIAMDYPNYPIREFMLDIGRKYFPMWYLEDLMKYAAWFKLTDFQAHLSEDTFNDYSAFRLESDIPHLTSTDGYYTKEEYREFQQYAQTYGVRVITEIDGPAHSRRFIELSQYDDVPEEYKNIALNDTMLNLSEENGSRDRVFALMDAILEEYLGGDDPVIITDAFNIGMDEYYGDENDLRAYAVHMYDKVVNTYGKTAFGWDSNASLPNATYTSDDYPIDDVIINFWKWEEVSGGMKALMDAGYKVVNGDHRWYIVPGAQIGFYDYCNEEKLFNEVSAGSMIGWYGNGIKFAEGHPNIVGGNMLLWNDRGMFAGYTVNDIFARQQSQYPYLSQAYWSGKQDRNESFETFKARLDAIEQAPSMSNLDKSIPSQSDLVYDFDMESLQNDTLLDQSGNGYDATVVNGVLTGDADNQKIFFNGDGYIQGAHAALKWPMSAVFDLNISKEQSGDITLFEEIMPDQQCVLKDGQETGQEKAVIVLKEQEDGTYQLTYSREGFTFSHDFFFEKGKEYRIAMTSDESTITGGEYTKWNQPNKLYVNGQLVSTLQGPAKPEDFTGTWWVDSPSLNMPLEKIGQNLVGTLDNFKLYNRVLTDAEIAALGAAEDDGQQPDTPDPDEPLNLALNKPVSASSSKSADLSAENAVDGNTSTRWASNYNSSVNDPFDKEEWVAIDLGSVYPIGEIRLLWEDAYARRYTIQTSEDGQTFSNAYIQENGSGNTETLSLNGTTARYIRFVFQEAVPSEDSWHWNYGYSLYEIEIYPEQTTTANVDKTLMALALEYALALDPTGVNELVLNQFQLAIEQAQALLENEKATQEEVDQAWMELTRLIHMMSFTTDKSALQILVDTCEGLDLTLYQDGEEKDEFLAALEFAKSVLEDPTALTDQSIAQAIERLEQAKAALIPLSTQIDTRLLQMIYDATKDTDLDAYIEPGKAEFLEALANAKAVLADPQSQQQINEAAYALNNAYLQLRLRPDESLLEQLRSFLQTAKTIDRTLFSEEELKMLDTLSDKVEAALAAADSNALDRQAAFQLVSELQPMIERINNSSRTNESVQPAQATSESVSTSASWNTGLWILLTGGALAFSLEQLRRKTRKQ